MDVEMMFRELRNRINRLFDRGRITDVDGTRAMRTVQLEGLYGDIRDDVEHFEPYGFTSEPHVGAEVLMMSRGGDRDHTIAVCVADRRYRPKGLKPGEACLFDDLGRRVFLLRDKVLIEGVDSPIEINTTNTITLKGSKIILDAPVEATSTITAKGDVTDNSSSGGRSMSGMREIFNGHTHHHGDPKTSTPNQGM